MATKIKKIGVIGAGLMGSGIAHVCALAGYDIYLILRYALSGLVNWIVVNGSSDMSKIYPIVDFYLRPNRHDGMPCMVRECLENLIPYYWSFEKPDIQLAIKKIEGLL